jgi:hypothetical protein
MVKTLHQNENGQATIEYVLLLLIVVGAYSMIFNWVNNLGLADRLAAPLTTTYARVYKYGHPQAKGFDEGTPENHPRIVINNKTRMFINPRGGN